MIAAVTEMRETRTAEFTIRVKLELAPGESMGSAQARVAAAVDLLQLGAPDPSGCAEPAVVKKQTVKGSYARVIEPNAEPTAREISAAEIAQRMHAKYLCCLISAGKEPIFFATRTFHTGIFRKFLHKLSGRVVSSKMGATTMSARLADGTDHVLKCIRRFEPTTPMRELGLIEVREELF